MTTITEKRERQTPCSEPHPLACCKRRHLFALPLPAPLAPVHPYEQRERPRHTSTPDPSDLRLFFPPLCSLCSSQLLHEISLHEPRPASGPLHVLFPPPGAAPSQTAEASSPSERAQLTGSLSHGAVMVLL